MPVTLYPVIDFYTEFTPFTLISSQFTTIKNQVLLQPTVRCRPREILRQSVIEKLSVLRLADSRLLAFTG